MRRFLQIEVFLPAVQYSTVQYRELLLAIQLSSEVFVPAVQLSREVFLPAPTPRLPSCLLCMAEHGTVHCKLHTTHGTPHTTICILHIT